VFVSVSAVCAKAGEVNALESINPTQSACAGFFISANDVVIRTLTPTTPIAQENQARQLGKTKKKW
jgi:hypothetical protein